MTITTDDIANVDFKYAVLNTEFSAPFVTSLHKTKEDAEKAWRKLGAGGRIAIRHHTVATLDGPAPQGYGKLYKTMRSYLFDA